MSVEITTPVGRLVGGHPMVQRAVTDRQGKPKFQKDGVTPRQSIYVGVAIAKGSEQHWNQTEWGSKIWQQGAADWPRGEFNNPSFAWKVTDGDSQTVNKEGNRPCDKEGYPGHWVLQCSTELPFVKCYHAGKYDPTQQIQNKDEIKPGDYCRVLLEIKGNGPDSESPGVYMNPSLFELTRAGVEIILSTGPSASDAFGGSAPQLPPGAQVDTAVAPPAVPQPTAPAAQPAAAPPPQQAVTPAPDFLNPPGAAPAPQPAAVAPPPAAPEPVRYLLNGQAYTEAQLTGAGWSAEQIAALPRA